MEEFLRSIPEDLLPSVVAEIDDVGDVVQNYADQRSAKAAAIINAKTAASQEVGPLPPIADTARRELCSKDLVAFSLTYFARTFYLPLAPYQKEMLKRFENVILNGGKEAHAVRRGGLKSTCARVAAIWAAINGHRRFPMLVGATDDKANEHRENFFDLLASSALLAADYPELIPLILKSRQPKKSYRLNGELLTVHHKDDRGRIVFPDIHTAPCCQIHVSPYSLAATDVSGLSYVDRFGVTIRPDLIIYDDVQTPQSAQSPTMTDEREDRITKTFGGLEGLGQDLAQIMVCTVRQHQDLTERFVDRTRHPDWYGKKYKSILRMPDRMDLWETYKTLLGTGATPVEGKAAAQQMYVNNREAMDAGASVAWEYDIKPGEVSALQSLMTVWANDPEFFRREIQQEGSAPANTSGLKLDSQQVIQRLSHIERGKIPQDASYQVAFVDSQDEVLFWMVCGFRPDLTGWIVDYGTFPDQGRPIFYKSDLSSKISSLKPGAPWEECFVLAHNTLEDVLFLRYPELDMVLKDWSDGQHMPLIRGQIQASANRSRMRPAKGFTPKPGKKPIHLWGDERDKSGTGWIERRKELPVHIQFDANMIKSLAARRLLTVVGAPSAIVLPGDVPYENRLLVDHFTAENPIEISYDGSHGVKWEQIPGRDNDWWDCFCGCVTAALVTGCKLHGDTGNRKERRTFQLPGGVRG